VNAPSESFPLAWPVGWPRTRSPRRSAFKGWTNYSARTEITDELKRLGATAIMLSSNIPVRLDGLPYSNAREPADHGVAVYFRIKGEPRVLACDKWDRCADNMVALAKHVEAIRGQLRWGVGSLEQAFGGYRALPAVAAKRQWWEVLGIAAQAPTAEVEARRIALLERCHPDRGGGALGEAQDINVAWDEFRRERGLVS
jgi:hypothetical protein